MSWMRVLGVGNALVSVQLPGATTPAQAAAARLNSDVKDAQVTYRSELSKREWWWIGWCDWRLIEVSLVKGC